jgi:hypothetical protein
MKILSILGIEISTRGRFDIHRFLGTEIIPAEVDLRRRRRRRRRAPNPNPNILGFALYNGS